MIDGWGILYEIVLRWRLNQWWTNVDPVLCCQKVSQSDNELILYMLYFTETTWKYIYIVYHFSTRVIIQGVEFFFKETESTCGHIHLVIHMCVFIIVCFIYFLSYYCHVCMCYVVSNRVTVSSTQVSIFLLMHYIMFLYNDVIMSTIVSKITGVSIVCTTFGSGADQRKHQSSASLAFAWGIHHWPVNSPHKRPVTRKIFPFDDVIMCNIAITILYTNSPVMCSSGGLADAQRESRRQELKLWCYDNCVGHWGTWSTCSKPWVFKQHPRQCSRVSLQHSRI